MHPLVYIFTFVLLGAGLVFLFASAMHKRQLAYKERKEALDREHANGGPGVASSEVAQLKERVQVLERLATDRGQMLADEIENLRVEAKPEERA